MECNRKDCFAFTVLEQNQCAALTDTTECHFYKSRELHERQRAELKAKGKPYYEAAKTAKDIKILAELLKKGGRNG